MIKIWGRKTSSNVQKAMWAVGELNLEHQRIDVGGAFGKNKEPPYLAMNPNGLVPTLEEEDGFLLWESNTVVRYLAGKHDRSGALEPKDPKHRALASQSFAFRPALARHYTFNGKHRTLYLAPWEDRIVDLLLYRVLNRRLHTWFSPHSYAYRDSTYGLDACQEVRAGVGQRDRARGPDE